MARFDEPEPANDTTVRQQAIYGAGLAGRKPALPAQASAPSAAAIGRPLALAPGGQAGVARWLENRAAEFGLSRVLTGAGTVADLHPGLVESPHGPLE